MKKRWRVIVCIGLLTTLLSGCGGMGGGEDKENQLKPMGKDDEAKIKVMFWDSNYFFQEYGNMFATQFPNVEIEVVNMQSIYSEDSTETIEKKFDKFVEENQPDVLFLQTEFERYAQNGKLFPLDSVIKQDEFDLTGIHPAILKLLREQGGGKLYGLSPDFSSAALFYNVDLFKKYGVELPRDSMSWEEVLELAKRFPTDGDKDKRIYGLSADNYVTVDSLIQTIGDGQDLRLLNANATEFNINTDSWKKVFQSAIIAAKSGALYVPTPEDQNINYSSIEDYFKQNLFVMGRSAMSFKYSYEVNVILQAKEQMKSVTPVNWGIVTAPVDPNNRNQSSYFSLGSIFAVNANSANKQAAWELVKYINSDGFAKLKSKSNRGNLLSRTEFNADVDGRSMEPFYKLEPKANTYNEYRKAPVKFFSALTDIMKPEIDAVLKDKKTLEEALKTIQEKGQEELLKAKKEAEKAAEKESAPPEAAKEESASADASTNAFP